MFEAELINEICSIGRVATFKPDTVILDIGDEIEFLPILLSGSAKVFTEDDDGKELLLYYLESGDTCATTLGCCSRNNRSNIRVVNEEEIELLMIPTDKFDEWMAKYKSWRDFVLETFTFRFNELHKAIDSLAFSNMNERLFQYLRDKAMITGDTTIKTTHAQIANDLHSSRVVISRLMKQLEDEGTIQSRRNSIELLKMNK